MNSINRGQAVIICIEKFLNPKLNRNGSENDVNILKTTFSNLGFYCKTYLNLTGEDLLETIIKYSNEDYSDDDCFALIIMSHGISNKIFGSDLESITYDQIFNPFKKNKTLENKPKLFFIQACRSSGNLSSNNINNDGIECDEGKLVETDLPTEKLNMGYSLESDFLFFYSTVPGSVAYRDKEKGSWFIQDLCQVLNENRENEFYTNLLNVNSLIYQKSLEVNIEKIQMPSIESRLTKKLYFTIKKRDDTSNKGIFFQMNP